ncbi:MAG: amidohydrolase family protein [candidate division KSB1 bacterium]|nr:amidohydrolase family protein [candidate division KSB1 bacterium]
MFEYPDSSFIGRSLAELAGRFGVSPVDMAIKIQLEGDASRPGGARIRGFSMWEGDIEAYMRQPWTATCTDGAIALPEDGPVHARFYGTFPRKIRRYALERKAITLENAIRSSTSLPAQILGLRDRGMIREGFWADIAILNLDAIRDRATFFEPHQYPEGVEYVLVNGQFVVKKGKLTWALPGKVLTGKEF